MLAWSLRHDIRVVMSLRGDGDLRDPGRRADWCHANRVPLPAVLTQVHGIEVVISDRCSPDAPPQRGDAMVAHGDHPALGVFGSDCPPLVIATPDACGVAHCGWRGTAAGIVPQLCTTLERVSRHPSSHWSALIGPGVHPDDFEVDAPVLEARAWPADAIRPSRPGHAWLDLVATIRADCRRAGLNDIIDSGTSTSRHPELRSHRRHGVGHPQLLVAWRSSCVG